MTLTLYNTLTRRKEPFQPIDPSNVRMYVCGPTVYDLAHIGNARPIIVFDVLFRLLRHIYGADHVTYARNITDVDDKINARAVERYPGLDPIVAIRKLTEETTAQFHKDIAALGVLPPTVEPRATDHIEGMRKLCGILVANGHAYVAEDHVLFAVNSMPDYGKLARRSLEEMEAGARVDVAPYKRGPMDFVLWKPSKPGEPAWPSPAGIAAPGRPGWHIECSAMAEKHLGPVFDIHGGGIDLVFPHHENEVAQSRCAHGTPVMANYWMHNGFLQVEGEKMSKSLGNFVTIKELRASSNFGGKRWKGEVLRLAMLTTSYRQPIDWTVRLLEDAEKRLARWMAAARGFQLSDLNIAPSNELIRILNDDLNTPEMIVYLDRLASKTNIVQGPSPDFVAALRFLGYLPDRSNAIKSVTKDLRAALLAMSKLENQGIEIDYENDEGDLDQVRLLVSQLEAYKALLSATLADARHVRPAKKIRLKYEQIKGIPSSKLAKICDLLSIRLDARKAGDWSESDRLRDSLSKLGVQLKDSKDPQTGEPTTTWELRSPDTREVKR